MATKNDEITKDELFELMAAKVDLAVAPREERSAKQTTLRAVKGNLRTKAARLEIHADTLTAQGNDAEARLMQTKAKAFRTAIGE